MFDIGKYFTGNNPSGFIAVVLFLLLIYVLYMYYKKKKTYNEITHIVPEDGVVIPGYNPGQSVPIADILKYAPERKDLYYGYYSSLDRTFNQVKDHVSLFWHSHFFDWDWWVPDSIPYVNHLETILRDFNGKFVLDLSPMLCMKDPTTGKNVCRPNAAERLTVYFDILASKGLLHKVSYLYPVDEPNLTMLNEAEHNKILDATYEAKAKYTELTNSKVMVIYAVMDVGYWNVQRHDVVGVDKYKFKSTILTSEHQKLKSMLREGQTMAVVPGAGYGHDPEPFFAYAMANPSEVEMIIPFVYFDDPNHKDDDYKGLEARDEEYRNRWISLANTHANKNTRI